LSDVLAGGKTGATRDDALEALTARHAPPVPFLDPIDVSNAVVHLASEDGRYVSGTARVIDAGELNRPKAPNQLIPLNTLSTNGSHNTRSRRRIRDYRSAGPSSVRYIAATWAYPAEEYFRLSQLLR
jgi:hypothetical protein